MTEAIRHSTLQSFQAKFNSPPNGPYQSFHILWDSLIIDVLKQAAEARWNARLNSDDKQAENAEGADGASGAERAITCPQPILHKGRLVRIIFIQTSGVIAGQARLLPWVMHGNTTPNKSWLAILRHYTLQELGEVACQ